MIGREGVKEENSLVLALVELVAFWGGVIKK